MKSNHPSNIISHKYVSQSYAEKEEQSKRLPKEEPSTSFKSPKESSLDLEPSKYCGHVNLQLKSLQH